MTSAMILAGSMMFAGSAGADVSFLSTFDNGSQASNDGSWKGFTTYAYSENYTLSTPSGSGSHYGKTNDGPLTTVIDLTNHGTDTASITAGEMSYHFSAYLGSYTANGDRAAISYQFRDASDTPIGNPTVFDDALSNLPNGTWTQYSTTAGLVPRKATSVIITVFKSPSVKKVASKNDGYVDLVRFNTQKTSKSSPGTLLSLGGISLILRDRE